MEFGLNYRAFEGPLRFAQSWISNASMMVSGGFFMIFPMFSQYFSIFFGRIFHDFPYFSHVLPNIFPWFSWVGHFRRIVPHFFPDFFQFSVAHRQRPAPWWFCRHGDSLAAELERFRERSQIWACVSAAEEYDLQTFNRWISHIYVK